VAALAVQVERLSTQLEQLEHRIGGNQETPFDYFAFERRFRGSVAEIKSRQAQYLHLFTGRGAVLDIGCGRGEFLELLTEHGVKAHGVDMNPAMVECCRDRRLTVVHGDMFDHLSSLQDGGLDGIFAAQVVEHLPPGGIARLIGLCAAKLRPGGVMVAETVNPCCPIALGHFFLDPSHVRPVPAELLRFMFEQHAFRIQAVRYSAPIEPQEPGRVEIAADGLPVLSGYQDYAVIAVRTPGMQNDGDRETHNDIEWQEGPPE
jgi:O-antigen chain-terminating methyltransferase